MRIFTTISYRFLLVSAAILTSGASTIAWGSEPGPAHGLTFRGAPKAETRGFLVTEFSVATRLKSHSSAWVVSHGSWDVGYMRNVGPRTAVGATAYLLTDDHYNEAYMIGLKPRFRYWLGRRAHTDVSAGLVFLDFGGGPFRFSYPGFVAQASIGYGDWGSVVLQYENIEFNYGYIPQDLTVRDPIWYLGVNVGSYPGAILGPLALAAVITVRNVFED